MFSSEAPTYLFRTCRRKAGRQVPRYVWWEAQAQACRSSAAAQTTSQAWQVTTVQVEPEGREPSFCEASTLFQYETTKLRNGTAGGGP